MEVLFKM